jgi:hypothetical protein
MALNAASEDSRIDLQFKLFFAGNKTPMGFIGVGRRDQDHLERAPKYGCVG